MENWGLKDTNIINLEQDENFVTFFKIRNNCYVLSNKKVYKIIENKMLNKKRKPCK